MDLPKAWAVVDQTPAQNVPPHFPDALLAFLAESKKLRDAWVADPQNKTLTEGLA